MSDAPPTDAPATDAPNTIPHPTDQNTTQPTTNGDEPLGDGGKRALDAERKARRDAEAKLKELEPLIAAAKEREDAEKSETTKLNEALTGERDARTKAELQLLRYTVAADKGISPKHVKFLTGSTKDEIEQSADELLAEFGTPKPGMPGRPSERLVEGRPSKSKLDQDDPVTLIRKGRGELPT